MLTLVLADDVVQHGHTEINIVTEHCLSAMLTLVLADEVVQLWRVNSEPSL